MRRDRRIREVVLRVPVVVAAEQHQKQEASDQAEPRRYGLQDDQPRSHHAELGEVQPRASLAVVHKPVFATMTSEPIRADASQT